MSAEHDEYFPSRENLKRREEDGGEEYYNVVSCHHVGCHGAKLAAFEVFQSFLNKNDNENLIKRFYYTSIYPGKWFR